ncbi:MAG: hypothetical protein JW864_04325 [Spirochaetes bacterium]|nr:hypothetical protein [Spirochaetota bacterium]
MKKITSGEKTPETLRKRRLSRIILLIDIIIIVVILIIFRQESRVPAYYTTSLSINEIGYRASITREEETGSYLFLLTVKSESNMKKIITYTAHLAKINIKYNENYVYDFTLGSGTEQIILLPEEVKTFLHKIDYTTVKNFSREHNEAIKPERKTLIPVKKYVPLECIITINTGEKTSAKLNFNYMVE